MEGPARLTLMSFHWFLQSANKSQCVTLASVDFPGRVWFFLGRKNFHGFSPTVRNPQRLLRCPSTFHMIRSGVLWFVMIAVGSRNCRWFSLISKWIYRYTNYEKILVDFQWFLSISTDCRDFPIRYSGFHRSALLAILWEDYFEEQRFVLISTDGRKNWLSPIDSDWIPTTRKDLHMTSCLRWS